MNLKKMNLPFDLMSIHKKNIFRKDIEFIKNIMEKLNGGTSTR